MAKSLFDRRAFHKLALSGVGGSLWMQQSARSEDPVTMNHTAEQSTEPLPFVAGSFTIVVLPDTQHYSRMYHHHFFCQTEWVVANKEKHNIQFVAHLGDVTDNNSHPEWKIAQQAMRALCGVVPYSLATGNHDHGPTGIAENRDTLINDYFPWAEEHRRLTFGGAMEEGRLENAYHVFAVGKHKFLLLALEWGPRDSVVEWANTVAAQHADHHALLVTHAYMYFDDTRHDWDKHGKQQRWNPRDDRFGTSKLPGGSNDGQQLWEKLVAKHKHFFLTINGHILEDGLGRLTSRLPGGGTVHQMAVNYQMHAEGGKGYLRLLEFLPEGNAIQVKSYSPSTGKYKTDPLNQFVLELEPTWSA